ncbi:MAG: hypothetical protein IK016_01420 [Lachnospiraceae bacterium]|nr:hypothetical protein [Lachnospiraceae bacterium]
MNNKTSRMAVVSELSVFVVWLVFVVTMSKGIYSTGRFFTTIICGLLSFGVAIASVFFVSGRRRRNLTEVRALPVLFSAVYLLIALIVNAVFLLNMGDSQIRMQIIINTVLLAFFAVIFIGSGEYLRHVEVQTEKVIEKTGQLSDISMRLGSIISLSKDEEIKRRVLSLKEKVDYSGNITQSKTADLQNEFGALLMRIEETVQVSGSSEKVSALIDEAERIWSARNAVAAVMH